VAEIKLSKIAVQMLLAHVLINTPSVTPRSAGSASRAVGYRSRDPFKQKLERGEASD
jgi:hypothetical protein